MDDKDHALFGARPQLDHVNNPAKALTWTDKRVKTLDYESAGNVRCVLCELAAKRESMIFYNRFGGLVCKNCYADSNKKPCPECFTIHAGECY